MYEITQSSFFPASIDSQVYTAWLSCKRKWANEHTYHLRQSLHESTDLIAGGAFAAGLEAARNSYHAGGLDPDLCVFEAYKAAVADYGMHEPLYKPEKSLVSVIDALTGYFDYFPLDADDLPPIRLADGKPAVEARFSIPLGLEHPETGKELCYTGTMDMVVESLGGVYPLDDKTTGGNFTANWAAQWELRNQFLGYIWALSKADIVGSGVIVRGVSFPKQANLSMPAKHQYIQLPIMVHPEAVRRWEAQMRQEVRAMLAAYAEAKRGNPNYPLALGTACTDYSRKCSYHNLCTAKTPKLVASANYAQRVWVSELREHLPLDEFRLYLKEK